MLAGGDADVPLLLIAEAGQEHSQVFRSVFRWIGGNQGSSALKLLAPSHHLRFTVDTPREAGMGVDFILGLHWNYP